MTQIPPPNNVVLHCEIEVDGKPLWADSLVSQQAWDAADEFTREMLRNQARRALADAIARYYQPVVDAVAVTAARPDTGSTPA